MKKETDDIVLWLQILAGMALIVIICFLFCGCVPVKSYVKPEDQIMKYNYMSHEFDIVDKDATLQYDYMNHRWEYR